MATGQKISAQTVATTIESGDIMTIVQGGDNKQLDYDVLKDSFIQTYSTAWINRSDWTNVHMGTDDTKNTDSNLTHGLSAPLSDLIVKVFISTDGTDANSFEVVSFGVRTEGGNVWGITYYQVDDDNILIQTATSGLVYITSAGSHVVIDSEDWYYKIKVYKIS